MTYTEQVCNKCKTDYELANANIGTAGVIDLVNNGDSCSLYDPYTAVSLSESML